MKTIPMRPLVFLLLFSLAGPAWSQANWNPAAAASYLDDRMDAWFAGAKQVQTGDGETRCISCHTSVPYALARPALRRALHATSPTPQEIRLIADVTRRVDTYGSQQPFYDSDEAKRTESRGTEAVLNALLLAGAEPAAPATRAAFTHLWETQRADGAWDWQQFGLEPFESAASVAPW